MDGVGEERVAKCPEKKHKKRKHGELRDVGGEDVRDVQLDRKKTKHEGLSGDCASQVVVNVEEGVSEDSRSRKEKKREKRRLKDGDKNEFQKVKVNKSGNGVEEGNSRGKEALDGMHGEESDGKRVNDNVSSGAMDSIVGEVVDKVKLKKDKKEKKKKNKSEHESNENGSSGRWDVSGHGDIAEKQIGHQSKSEGLSGKCVSEVVLDVGEEIRSGKEKKKEKMKTKKSGNVLEGSREASGGMDGEVGGGKSVNNSGSSGLMGSKVEGELIEKVKLKKDKKEKKKKSKSEPKSNENDDSGRSDIGGQINEKVDLVENKKRKKKVSRVNEEEGLLKNDELNNAVTDKDELIDRHKKKKKKNKENDPGASLSNENVSSKGVLHSESNNEVTDKDELIDGHKKKKKKNKENNSGASLSNENVSSKGVLHSESHEAVVNGVSKKRKKKRLAVTTEEHAAGGVSTTDEENESTAPGEKSKPGKKSGRVSFAESVEVFSLPDNASEDEDYLVDEDHPSKRLEDLADADGIIRGKRFSKEEDGIIRNAVLKYIEDNQLGEKGLEMVLKCGKHKETRGCWDVIAAALPWRGKLAVYCRAHILFERSESQSWSKEELEQVREFHEKHGPKWRQLADEIGRNRIHVKDAFRQVRLATRKNGPWSQDEYQNLFNSVNESLRIRALMDRKTQHGMLRDNIGWGAVSSKLGTRTDPICCMKWYDQLTSTLVSSGQWADTDDHRLLMALVEIDATCEEEVEWDNVLEHRPGDVCRKRWNQMVRHIGEHGTKSFSEQVEILSKRYVPDVLEARETYDSKPFVDLLFGEELKD